MYDLFGRNDAWNALNFALGERTKSDSQLTPIEDVYAGYLNALRAPYIYKGIGDEYRLPKSGRRFAISYVENIADIALGNKGGKTIYPKAPIPKEFMGTILDPFAAPTARIFGVDVPLPNRDKTLYRTIQQELLAETGPAATSYKTAITLPEHWALFDKLLQASHRGDVSEAKEIVPKLQTALRENIRQLGHGAARKHIFEGASELTMLDGTAMLGIGEVGISADQWIDMGCPDTIMGSRFPTIGNESVMELKVKVIKGIRKGTVLIHRDDAVKKLLGDNDGDKLYAKLVKPLYFNFNENMSKSELLRQLPKDRHVSFTMGNLGGVHGSVGKKSGRVFGGTYLEKEIIDAETRGIKRLGLTSSDPNKLLTNELIESAQGRYYGKAFIGHITNAEIQLVQIADILGEEAGFTRFDATSVMGEIFGEMLFDMRKADGINPMVGETFYDAMFLGREWNPFIGKQINYEDTLVQGIHKLIADKAKKNRITLYGWEDAIAQGKLTYEDAAPLYADEVVRKLYAMRSATGGQLSRLSSALSFGTQSAFKKLQPDADVESLAYADSKLSRWVADVDAIAGNRGVSRREVIEGMFMGEYTDPIKLKEAIRKIKTTAGKQVDDFGWRDRLNVIFENNAQAKLEELVYRPKLARGEEYAQKMLGVFKRHYSDAESVAIDGNRFAINFTQGKNRYSIELPSVVSDYEVLMPGNFGVKHIPRAQLRAQISGNKLLVNTLDIYDQVDEALAKAGQKGDAANAFYSTFHNMVQSDPNQPWSAEAEAMQVEFDIKGSRGYSLAFKEQAMAYHNLVESLTKKNIIIGGFRGDPTKGFTVMMREFFDGAGNKTVDNIHLGKLAFYNTLFPQFVKPANITEAGLHIKNVRQILNPDGDNLFNPLFDIEGHTRLPGKRALGIVMDFTAGAENAIFVSKTFAQNFRTISEVRKTISDFDINRYKEIEYKIKAGNAKLGEARELPWFSEELFKERGGRNIESGLQASILNTDLGEELFAGVQGVRVPTNEKVQGSYTQIMRRYHWDETRTSLKMGDQVATPAGRHWTVIPVADEAIPMVPIELEGKTMHTRPSLLVSKESMKDSGSALEGFFNYANYVSKAKEMAGTLTGDKVDSAEILRAMDTLRIGNADRNDPIGMVAAAAKRAGIDLSGTTKVVADEAVLQGTARFTGNAGEMELRNLTGRMKTSSAIPFVLDKFNLSTTEDAGEDLKTGIELVLQKKRLAEMGAATPDRESTELIDQLMGSLNMVNKVGERLERGVSRVEAGPVSEPVAKQLAARFSNYGIGAKIGMAAVAAALIGRGFLLQRTPLDSESGGEAHKSMPAGKQIPGIHIPWWGEPAFIGAGIGMMYGGKELALHYQPATTPELQALREQISGKRIQVLTDANLRSGIHGMFESARGLLGGRNEIADRVLNRVEGLASRLDWGAEVVRDAGRLDPNAAIIDWTTKGGIGEGFTVINAAEKRRAMEDKAEQFMRLPEFMPKSYLIGATGNLSTADRAEMLEALQGAHKFDAGPNQSIYIEDYILEDLKANKIILKKERGHGGRDTTVLSYSTEAHQKVEQILKDENRFRLLADLDSRTAAEDDELGKLALNRWFIQDKVDIANEYRVNMVAGEPVSFWHRDVNSLTEMWRPVLGEEKAELQSFAKSAGSKLPELDLYAFDVMRDRESQKLMVGEVTNLFGNVTTAAPEIMAHLTGNYPAHIKAAGVAGMVIGGLTAFHAAANIASHFMAKSRNRHNTLNPMHVNLESRTGKTLKEKEDLPYEENSRVDAKAAANFEPSVMESIANFGAMDSFNSARNAADSASHSTNIEFEPDIERRPIKVNFKHSHSKIDTTKTTTMVSNLIKQGYAFSA